jgi:serine/threonine protein kinase
MDPLGTGDPLRIGPYRLLGVLGEGGMGKVYFGQDSTGRTAAVKVLRPELAHDQNLAQRFVREAGRHERGCGTRPRCPDRGWTAMDRHRVPDRPDP